VLNFLVNTLSFVIIFNLVCILYLFYNNINQKLKIIVNKDDLIKIIFLLIISSCFFYVGFFLYWTFCFLFSYFFLLFMWIFIYNLLIKKYFFSNYSLRLKKINWKAKNCVSQFIKFVIINNARVNSFFLIYLFIKDNFSEKGSLFFNKNIFKYFTVNFIFRCLVYLLTGLPYLFIKKNIEFIDKLNSIYVLRRSLENYKKLSNASVLKAILTLTIQNCSIHGQPHIANWHTKLK